jgi:hypothetical protein
MADGAPTAIGRAHLQANAVGNLRHGSDSLKPFTGILKGFFNRVVKTIKMGMGFKQRID